MPFESGKTYQTKFQTGEKFTLTQDPYKRDKDGNIIKLSNTVYGMYELCPHLGVCPISSERLIPEIELVDKEIEVCGECGRELGATVAPVNKKNT